MRSIKVLISRIAWIIFFAVIHPTFVFSQANTYEIYALQFGQRLNKIPVADAAVGALGNDSLNVVFMYWLLKGNNGKTILVDAGFTDDQEINPKSISFTRPDKILDELNIKPSDISDIIITNPHWDHIGGIDLYPNAHVWMQKEDYDYFVETAWKKDGNNGGFNKTDVQKIIKRNKNKQLTLVNGDDVEILPGIKVFIGSKHTFQSQYVMVGSGDDKVIIASDNAWFYYNIISLLPVPVTFDAKAYSDNLKRMKSMVTNVDLIIPGHDPLVFVKFPRVAKDISRIK